MDHKDLDVWKKSIELVTTVYKITKIFPKEEQYGLTNQIRRSAISISSNIAEGAARNSNKEFIQFLYIALGSASELETQIIISQNLNYLEDNSKIIDIIVEIKQMLIGLIKYRKGKI